MSWGETLRFIRREVREILVYARHTANVVERMEVRQVQDRSEERAVYVGWPKGMHPSASGHSFSLQGSQIIMHDPDGSTRVVGDASEQLQAAHDGSWSDGAAHALRDTAKTYSSLSYSMVPTKSVVDYLEDNARMWADGDGGPPTVPPKGLRCTV